MSSITLSQALKQMPLVAIIRGVKPDEVLAITTAIKQAGFSIIEVPLNSPDPTKSIKIMADAMGEDTLIGAGTVITIADVDAVAKAGGRLIVSPNTDIDVIKHSKKLGLYSLPGFYTPSEAFTAIDAGADGLKMFPSDTLGVKGLKAVKTVLPPQMPLFAVGGVNAGNMADYLAAGAAGFGLGTVVYKAGISPDQAYKNAKSIVDAYRAAAQ